MSQSDVGSIDTKCARSVKQTVCNSHSSRNVCLLGVCSNNLLLVSANHSFTQPHNSLPMLVMQRGDAMHKNGKRMKQLYEAKCLSDDSDVK